MSFLTVRDSSDGWLLFLPLCPSTNARMRPVIMGRHAQNILTREARDYISTAAAWLMAWRRSEPRFRPISEQSYLDYWVLTPRSNADPHNYDKVFFDALERGGIVTDDKYLLPRLLGSYAHSPEPTMILKLLRPR